mgnify:FL=1
MTLLLVSVENSLHLVVQLGIHLRQLHRDILMDRAFAYPELLCRRADRCVVFHYVMSEYDTSFLIVFP